MAARFDAEEAELYGGGGVSDGSDDSVAREAELRRRKHRRRRQKQVRYTVDDRDDVEVADADATDPDADSDEDEASGDAQQLKRGKGKGKPDAVSLNAAARASLDPEAYVLFVLQNLALWQDPLMSSLSLALVLLVFGLLHYSRYSLVTLAAFMGLFQLSLTTVAVHFTPVLRDAGIVRKRFTAERFAEQQRLLQPEDLAAFSAGLGQLCARGVARWEALLLRDSENPRVLAAAVGAFAALAVLGLVVPGYLVLLALCAALLTMPRIYMSNQELWDDGMRTLLAGVTGQTRSRRSLSSDSDAGDDRRAAYAYEDDDDNDEDDDY